MKKVVKKKPVEEDISTQGSFKDFLKNSKNTDEDEGACGFDFMGLLTNPALKSLLDSGKEMFKKEKPDPNICEINIKAPSEVVLKLFNIKG